VAASSEHRGARWTWARLGRIALLTLLGLASVDHLLRARERSLDLELWSGQLRNAAGPGIADTSRLALLEAPEERRRGAVVLVGSSVTFGPGVDPTDTIGARLAARLARDGHPWPVANLAQPGGGPRTSVPIAAAFGTRPVRLLLVELLVTSFAEHEPTLEAPFPIDEVALLEAASPAQRPLLAAAGVDIPPARRVEAWISDAARSHWRFYRLRGSLWWDREFTPTYLVWSLRRELASAGFLPKRFRGQTTNVGKLPWRRAYTGGQRPGPNQRLQIPNDRIAEDVYALLRLTQELADRENVPVLFYEIPLNLTFEREFSLTTEDDLTHLAELRRALLARMRANAMQVLEAPSVPDDAFLDKAHLTPLGAQQVADHLADSLEQVFPNAPAGAG